MKRKDKLILALACFFVSAGQLRAQYIGRVGIDNAGGVRWLNGRASAMAEGCGFNSRPKCAAAGEERTSEIPNGPTILSTAKANLDAWLKAVRVVESGDREDVKAGDAGRSIGPYQIMRGYWYDSTHRPIYQNGKVVGHVKIMDGEYEDCRNREYATQVVLSYMRRYAAEALKAGDWEKLGKIHNGGPRGERVAATEKYWNKVKKEMERAK